MESIKIVSLEQALALIAEIDPRDLIFWIGAGIDRRAPTCLPLGDDLRSEFLKFSIGNTLSELIDDEWKRTYEQLAILLSKRVWLSESQRLETIIDCIQEFEDNLLVKDSSVIKGLSCFEDVEPNHNHFVLAHYLLKGASVVTTNYENCMQKAYARITKNHQALSISYEDPASSVYVFCDKCYSSGEVHYIHGIASEPKKIGISLSSIKKGLGEEFPKWFNEWVREGKTIVYLGYSGSDSQTLLH